MKLLIGALTVICMVLGGYLMVGGDLLVLWQPAEVVIIIGASVGAFIITNSGKTMHHVKHDFKFCSSGIAENKEIYMELLLLLFSVFKTARSKGLLSLEAEIDNPKEGELFQNYPNLLNKTPHVITFLCDYLRMITMGCENPMQMETLIDEELDLLKEEQHHISGAVQTMADGMPALGIVAAVLGVIKTMGSIDQPPAVLGKLIGGALVGTFLGVWVSYGFLAPIAGSIKEGQQSHHMILVAIKAGILAYLNGYAPIVAVEFVRKNIESEYRPSFAELEAATQDL